MEELIQNLPNKIAAERFFAELQLKQPVEAKKLLRPANRGLLSDVLTLAAFSEFLGATLLQNSGYFDWLKRKRSETQTRGREDLLESLARFSLTNSTLEPHVLLARFRRRELLRIYLRDIRGLAEIAEITGELSNLADAILQFALNAARQEIENRYGAPLETDEKSRTRAAQFVVVALGKLGSAELNYASDIDLLFLYSSDGATSGTGTRGATTNREFFGKLAELTAKIVGQTGGEMAAYRVDLRLRPHGRVGALAISVAEAASYYEKTARDWERQVLIRSRAAAGEAEVFKDFQRQIQSLVYKKDVSINQALANVRQSKQQINLEHASDKGFNVKLGTGGIREIEFIAQALQLAHGGADEWLREPHTLIALRRLSDRQILSERELTDLSDAYTFLRTLEHRLQMENGLQTHQIDDGETRARLAALMNCSDAATFDEKLNYHRAQVSAVFERIFDNSFLSLVISPWSLAEENQIVPNHRESQIFANDKQRTKDKRQKTKNDFCQISPYFAEIINSNPALSAFAPPENADSINSNYRESLASAIADCETFAQKLSHLRLAWTQIYLEIAALDASEAITMRESSKLQTELAEASLEIALKIANDETIQNPKSEIQNLAVLGLGKLGSRGMDYGSDLDLILIYEGAENPAEFYAQAARMLTVALSSLTREGFLYRVDLRLRPDGKNGATANDKTAFLNYLQHRAAIWEWLAYVKLRGVGGNPELARMTETEARRIVHANAGKIAVDELKTETKRVRNALETQKTKNLRHNEFDIKHGAGGLLDVYFAVRFLQLRDNIADEAENRTTAFSLGKLREAGSLDAENFEVLRGGYEFLRELDHALRLTHGRSTRVNLAGTEFLQSIAARLRFASATDLLGALTVHTADIRRAFEQLLD